MIWAQLLVMSKCVLHASYISIARNSHSLFSVALLLKMNDLFVAAWSLPFSVPTLLDDLPRNDWKCDSAMLSYRQSSV